MATPLNEIPEKQNAEAQLTLLRARQQTYAEASRLLVLQLVLTVLVPVAAAIAGLVLPCLRSYTAALALIITVLDVAALDRLQRKRLKLAAKIAEAFDVAVLDLPWNRFVAGRRADPEAIAGAAAAWARRKTDKKLLDWYPPSVGKAPLHLARIICQRTNLWYDATLRRHYGAWVLGLAAILVVGLFAGALITGLTVNLFVTTVLAPAAPILTWSMREYFRQKDTAEAQETLKSDAEALWDRASAGHCDEPDCFTQSREFQNAIYARRSSSPLMIPGIYPWRRPNMEQQMNRGAEAYLKELGIDA
jgi:hypothetical protein